MLQVVVPGCPTKHEVGQAHSSSRNLGGEVVQHVVVEQGQLGKVVGQEVQELIRVADLQAVMST